jgi:hypothetical protein
MHDEIDISVPEDDLIMDMKILKEVMNRDRFDVPMRSEGFWGYNFGELHAMDS